jgi:hypothetical protein
VLTEVERIRNYEWQNRNFRLTARQQRRVNKKRRHQAAQADRLISKTPRAS